MKRQLHFFRGILLLGIIFFTSCAPSVFSNTLKIHYYNNFSEFEHLDSRYGQPNKYLVYKYVSFTTDGNIHYVDVTLGFDVDKNWYRENKIEDIVFLRYSDGSWVRINYDSKINNFEDHLHYQLHSNKLGEYWAIVGVLPNGSNVVSEDVIINNKIHLKKINQNGINFFQKSGKNQRIEQFIEKGKKVVTILNTPANVGRATIASTGIIALSIAALIALLNGPTSFLLVFKQLVLAMVGLFSTKKKLRGGIVYDVNTGKPIPLVRVDIVDKKTERIKVTKFTNKEGRYYFLAPKGEYIVEAKKPKYRIVDISDIHFVKALLHKEDIFKEIKLNESGVIKKNIALLREDKKLYSQGTIMEILKGSLDYIAKVLFIIGLIFNIFICYVKPNFLNFSMLGIYVLVILFRWMFISREKYGTMIDENGKPEAFTTINIFEYKEHELVSRAVTDTKGRYYITLDKGKYLLEIKTNDGVVIKKTIKVLDKNTLSKKIIIKK